MRNFIYKNEYELNCGFTQVVEWYDDNTCIYYIKNNNDEIISKGTGQLKITPKSKG